MYHKPKVSIIIPVYNGEKYLSKAIDSATGQSLEEIEILLIDDGSTDNTPAILQQYKMSDNRIEVITQLKNSGLGPARNLGIEHTNGEYIFFLDADDYIHPNALEVLYEQAKRENLDILQSKYIRKKHNNKQIEPEDLTPLPSPVNGIEYFHQGFFISPMAWAKLYKTSFLKQKNLRFKNQINQDMPFVFEALTHANAVNNNLMPTYFYQINEYSISAKFSEKHITDYIRVLEDLQAYFMNTNLTNKNSIFPIQYFLFMARLSDRVLKFGDSDQKKRVKKYVEKKAKKYGKFLTKNKKYPFLKRMILKSSPYNYSLLSQTFKSKKHK